MNSAERLLAEAMDKIAEIVEVDFKFVVVPQFVWESLPSKVKRMKSVYVKAPWGPIRVLKKGEGLFPDTRGFLFLEDEPFWH